MTDLNERTRLSQALVDLDLRIHSRLSVDEVMQSALEDFVRAIRADAGHIMVIDGADWVVCYQFGLGAEVVGMRLSTADAPIATRVAQTGGPVVIEDFETEPAESLVSSLKQRDLRGVIAIPLVNRGEVTGSLFAWIRHDPRRFTPEEIEFAHRVAASVALALENARLFTSEQRARRRAEVAERELKRELERTRALNRASDELLTAYDPDEVLRRLANILLDASGAGRVFINLVDVRRKVLTPKIATGGLVVPTGKTIPFDSLTQTAREAIALSRPAVLDYDRPGIPESDRKISSMNRARVVLFVPLVHRGIVIGHVALDEPGERYDFSPEEIRVVSSIVALGAVALQNAEKTRERGVGLLERQVRRFAYGIHDGPMQTLSSAGAMLERATRAENPDAMLAQLAAVGGLLDYSLLEMRDAMREFRPAELEEESFVDKIRMYCEAFGRRWSMPVGVEVVGDETRIAKHIQITLFRVVQEALSNARKHSAAPSVDVIIRFGPTYVECDVLDGGCGFDVEETTGLNATGHWGLIGMQERMAMIGGEFEIVSSKGTGTEVRARAPLSSLGEVVG